MKKLTLILALASLPVVAFPNVSALASTFNACQHCIPVNEPTGDPCSIAGWCGNGNWRAKQQYYNPVTNTLEWGPCSNINGLICGGY